MTPCVVHSTQCSYQGDTLSLYNTLMPSPYTLLLEGAEIDTKSNTQSLLIAHTCVRIFTTGATTASAHMLSANGRAVLDTLRHTLGDFVCAETDNRLDFAFPPVDTGLAEHIRVTQPNVLCILRCLKDAYTDVFIGGVFGFDLLECAENLPSVPVGDNDCPNFVMFVAENLMVVDHIDKTTTAKGFVFTPAAAAQVQAQHQHLATLPPTPIDTQNHTVDTPQTVIPTANISDADFCHIVERCQDYIQAGDAFQIVPSRSFSMPCPKPLTAYAHLKVLNPSPYMFYMNDKHFATFGASPESALKYEADKNIVSLYPIAGTRPRGKHTDGTINTDLDTRYELDMLLDSKETSEHIMLVDLARNDIARISIPTTRQVKKLLQIDKYSHVQHLVSLVQGELRAEYDCLHAYQACMNMGTLTGAPKVRASEIIREMEQCGRGSYGGAVGYINGNGDMDTCITIRSAFVKNGTAHIGAGAGVVLQSVPQSEAQETRIKAMSVMTAIKNAHNYVLGDDNV